MRSILTSNLFGIIDTRPSQSSPTEGKYSGLRRPQCTSNVVPDMFTKKALRENFEFEEPRGKIEKGDSS